MACECIAMINDACERANNNTVLDIPFAISMSTGEVADSRVSIAVCKRDPKSRKRPIHIVPTHCPFCGVEYKAES